MDTHDDNPREPDRPDPDPHEAPTEPQPDTSESAGGTSPGGPQSPAGGASQAAAGPAAPGPSRPRLTRSSSDKMIAGVCGGVARHLGLDSTLVRIALVALVLFGGAGVLVYLAGVVLMPNEAGESVFGKPGERPSALTVIGVAVAALLLGPAILGGGFLLAGAVMPLAILALIGLVVYWLVSGEGPTVGGAAEVAEHAALGIAVLFACGAIAAGGGLAAGLGGGTVVAALVILAGVMLVAGAFIGGVRWLILPALSLALAVGFVSAAGIDLHGGVGEREYKPSSASEVRDGYRVGVGELIVDLREADLPKGDTRLHVDVGMGAARLIVPEDVCVASAAEIGIGAVDVFDRENGGIDVDWDDRPRPAEGNSRVIVDADIGVGALLVRHDRSGDFDGPRFGRGFRDHDEGGDEIGNVGCGETRAAR